MLKLNSNIGGLYRAGQTIPEDALPDALREQLLGDGGAEIVQGEETAPADPADPVEAALHEVFELGDQLDAVADRVGRVTVLAGGLELEGRLRVAQALAAALTSRAAFDADPLRALLALARAAEGDNPDAGKGSADAPAPVEPSGEQGGDAADSAGASEGSGADVPPPPEGAAGGAEDTPPVETQPSETQPSAAARPKGKTRR